MAIESIWRGDLALRSSKFGSFLHQNQWQQSWQPPPPLININVIHKCVYFGQIWAIPYPSGFLLESARELDDRGEGGEGEGRGLKGWNLRKLIFVARSKFGRDRMQMSSDAMDVRWMDDGRKWMGFTEESGELEGWGVLGNMTRECWGQRGRGKDSCKTKNPEGTPIGNTEMDSWTWLGSGKKSITPTNEAEMTYPLVLARNSEPHQWIQNLERIPECNSWDSLRIQNH